MLVAREHLDSFWAMVRELGVHPTVRDPPVRGEFGRFMLKGRFVIVRSLEAELSAPDAAGFVEVHCSEDGIGKELEQLFAAAMQPIVEGD